MQRSLNFIFSLFYMNSSILSEAPAQFRPHLTSGPATEMPVVGKLPPLEKWYRKIAREVVCRFPISRIRNGEIFPHIHLCHYGMKHTWLANTEIPLFNTKCLMWFLYQSLPLPLALWKYPSCVFLMPQLWVVMRRQSATQWSRPGSPHLGVYAYPW